MEGWLKASLDSHYIAKVDSGKVQHGVHCEAFLSPWYDDGIVFDWTTLHQRLVHSATTTANGKLYAEQFTAGLAQFGAEAASSAARRSKECFSTVVELKAPWSLHPLSDQAQDLSVFDAPADRAVGLSTSSPASSVETRTFYKFLRGPPGQRAVRDDMARVLASVQTQLRQNNIQVFCFLSSFVLVCEDFTELLHRTAAVFRALTEVGFTVDGHGSSLGPRAVLPLRVSGADTWTTLPLQRLTGETDVASFLVALFFQWLQDAYIWGCCAPLRLFPDPSSDRTEKKEEEKGVRLFEKFVRGLVLPHVHAVGLDALRATLPEDGGSFFELAAASLQKKVPPVGPQRWSVLELRLVLSQINAYHYVPTEYLSQPMATAKPCEADRKK